MTDPVDFSLVSSSTTGQISWFQLKVRFYPITTHGIISMKELINDMTLNRSENHDQWISELYTMRSRLADENEVTMKDEDLKLLIIGGIMSEYHVVQSSLEFILDDY